MKAVYYARLPTGGTDRHRMRALRERVTTLQVVRAAPESQRLKRYLTAMPRRAGYPIDDGNDNKRLLDAAAEAAPDLIWLDKPIRIRRSTLRRIREVAPAARLVSYSGDDYLYAPTSSRHLLRALPEYDAVITTKKWKSDALLKRGARHVIAVNNSFEPSVHRPFFPVDSSERSLDAVFLGAYERRRAGYVKAIGRAGVDVHVWGPPAWRVLANGNSKITYEGPALADEAYAEALSRAKVGLGFLRLVNGDQQTTRSVEIPACGALLISERTREHSSLFSEGQEALFFDTVDELIQQIRLVLSDDSVRISIAASGLHRAWTEPYTNDSMVGHVLTQLF